MKFYLDEMEFYITNVCNLNCTECDRFNNFYFHGQQNWDDYSDVYKKWSDIAQFGRISILGGEPLMNPTILDWVNGISTLWNETDVYISTNGTHINRVRGLYDTIKQYGGRVSIEISIHNKNDIESMLVNVEDFLEEFKLPLDEYRETLLSREGYVQMHDRNNVSVSLRRISVFDKSALIENNGVFRFHDSNPSRAISACNGKTCHGFNRGKLYKCMVMTTLVEFYEQFNFDISDEDIELIYDYKPLRVESDSSTISNFMDGLVNCDVIPQCKFCPESLGVQYIESDTNKKRVPKK
jgi:organic radical activating enzyme